MHVPHELAYDARLSTSEASVSTGIPGEVVILDPTSGRYYSLDGVGARVWELLSGSTNLATLLEAIQSEYHVDAATCERDVRALLDDLIAQGLVRVDAARP